VLKRDTVSFQDDRKIKIRKIYSHVDFTIIREEAFVLCEEECGFLVKGK